MKKYFLSFGGGGQNYIDACTQICSQANDFALFDGVTKVTDSDLSQSSDHSEFYEKYSNFITSNKRGFGFWIWKSYLIDWYINQLNDGDLLIYADSGCRLSNPRKMRTLFCFMENNIFLFAKTSHSNRSYTSSVVLEHFDDGVIGDSPMIEATTFAVKVSSVSRRMIKDWWILCQNLDFIQDPIKNLEPVGFIDHRHDQSLLSMIFYTRYHEYINKFDGALLHNALVPLRFRSKSTLNEYSGFFSSANSLIPLSYYSFQSVCLSSEHGSLRSDFDSLFSKIYKKDFCFHTNEEINPFISIIFREPIFVSVLVIENRKNFEGRISSLLVEISDEIDYKPFMKINSRFGGFYDGSPLIIGLPRGVKIKGLRITSVNVSPEFFHLKSIYLYE